MITITSDYIRHQDTGDYIRHQDTGQQTPRLLGTTSCFYGPLSLLPACQELCKKLGSKAGHPASHKHIVGQAGLHRAGSETSALRAAICRVTFRYHEFITHFSL